MAKKRKKSKTKAKKGKRAAPARKKKKVSEEGRGPEAGREEEGQEAVSTAEGEACGCGTRAGSGTCAGTDARHGRAVARNRHQRLESRSLVATTKPPAAYAAGGFCLSDAGTDGGRRQSPPEGNCIAVAAPIA